MGIPLRRTAGQQLFKQRLAFRQRESGEHGRQTGQDFLTDSLVSLFRSDQGKELFRKAGVQYLAGKRRQFIGRMGKITGGAGDQITVRQVFVTALHGSFQQADPPCQGGHGEMIRVRFLHLAGKLGFRTVQGTLAAFPAVPEGGQRPAAAGRLKQAFAELLLAFQLVRDIRKPLLGFFLFRVRQGNTVNGFDPHDAAFFRFLQGNGIFGSNGDNPSAGVLNFLPEGIGYFRQAKLVRQVPDQGKDLRQDSSERPFHNLQVLPLFRRDRIPPEKTAEKTVPGVRRKGTQRRGTVTVSEQGGDQVRKKPGGSVHEGRKGNGLFTQGLKGQNARQAGRMQTGGRLFRGNKEAAEFPGHHHVQHAERFRRTPQGGRHGEKPGGVGTSSAGTVRTADQVLFGQSREGSGKHRIFSDRTFTGCGRGEAEQADAGGIRLHSIPQVTQQGKSRPGGVRITKIAKEDDAGTFFGRQRGPEPPEPGVQGRRIFSFRCGQQHGKSPFDSVPVGFIGEGNPLAAQGSQQFRGGGIIRQGPVGRQLRTEGVKRKGRRE